jgi:hypothetical protein
LTFDGSNGEAKEAKRAKRTKRNFLLLVASFIFQITIGLTSRRQKGKCGKGK